MPPAKPTAPRCDELLRVLGELLARGGVARFVQVPIRPGRQTFPEPWRRTRGGIVAVLRRLAWHAGHHDREIVVHDERLGAPPTERKPETRVALTEIRRKQLVFTMSFVGEDNVAGTLAHELGVVHAALHRHDRGDPYRVAAADLTSDGAASIRVEDGDLERGSIATVALGLGVIAANAAYQQYSREGRWNGAYVPLEYDVLRAGYIPMSELAFLLAAQVIVRGGSQPPDGLEPPQRDEVSAWIAALAGQRELLRARLGITDDAAALERPDVVPFEDVDVDEEDHGALVRPVAFRWRGNRGGVGLLAGMVFGAGVALFVASRGTLPVFVVAGGGSGHLIGRRVRIARCSACVTVVALDARHCVRCRAELHGDIDRLSDRLEAEERLELEATAADGPAERA